MSNKSLGSYQNLNRACHTAITGSTQRIKAEQRVLFITFVSLGLLSMPGFAVSNAITTTDLLRDLSPIEPWHKGRLTATKTVNFQQSASGGTDATSVSKITLGYFTSANCTGSLAGSGFYTTPDDTSYTISVGKTFGIVAASTWNVGSTQLGITDMTTIGSMAITLKSTNNNTPQSDFSGSSFACIPVTCTVGPAGSCTSASDTQSFELKTTAAIGDPADGAVIGCLNTGVPPSSFNLVVPAADNSTSIIWGSSGVTTGATSTTDGATNTTTIVGVYGAGTYAAQLCNDLSVAGGYTSGWFLPSGGDVTDTQINCLYDNQVAIGGFVNNNYWSSTENNSNAARRKRFSDGSQANISKSIPLAVRCARALTP